MFWKWCLISTDLFEFKSGASFCINSFSCSFKLVFFSFVSKNPDKITNWKLKICSNLMKSSLCYSFCFKSAGIWNVFYTRAVCKITRCGFCLWQRLWLPHPKSIALFQSNLLSKSYSKNIYFKTCVICTREHGYLRPSYGWIHTHTTPIARQTAVRSLIANRSGF